MASKKEQIINIIKWHIKNGIVISHRPNNNLCISTLIMPDTTYFNPTRYPAHVNPGNPAYICISDDFMTLSIESLLGGVTLLSDDDFVNICYGDAILYLKKRVIDLSAAQLNVRLAKIRASMEDVLIEEELQSIGYEP